MHKLGLDLGTKTCGFAITDWSNVLVSPLENFFYPPGDFQQVLQRVAYWIREHDGQVDTIVLGYPTHLDGRPSTQTHLVEHFTKLLKDRFPDVSVVLEDERYSTREAMEELMKYGLTAAKRKKIKDQMAATIILENWLQKSKNRL